MNDDLRIVLIGPMATGKTTVGRILAQALSCRYFDNDEEMTLRYGLSQNELAALPVDELHELESRYLRDVMAEDPPFVTGLAGSVVDSERNRDLLKQAYCVYLYLPLEEVQRRTGGDGVGRQALKDQGEQVLIDRFNRRDPLYREVAKLELRERTSATNDVQQILAALSKIDA